MNTELRKLYTYLLSGAKVRTIMALSDGSYFVHAEFMSQPNKNNDIFSMVTCVRICHIN